MILFAFSVLALLVYEFIKIWMERNALRSKMEQIAIEYTEELFKRWKEEEMKDQKKQMEEALRREMDLKVKEYLEQKEAEIREDAIKRHEAVVTGKVTEHFIPYLPEFKYNPKDAIIGAPIDFVVFDGLSEGDLRYAFEMSHTSYMRKDLTVLVGMSGITNKLFIVAPEKRRPRFKNLIEGKPFRKDRDRLGFISYRELVKLHKNLKELRKVLDSLGIRAEF